MEFIKFYLIVLENIGLYLGFVFIFLGLHIIILRKRIYSILDPIIVFFIFQSFRMADVMIMKKVGIIEN